MYSNTQLHQIARRTLEALRHYTPSQLDVDRAAMRLHAALALCDAQNKADARNERNAHHAKRLAANSPWPQ